jgi:hypothetical protein
MTRGTSPRLLIGSRCLQCQLGHTTLVHILVALPFLRSPSEGEKIQKRVYIISGKFLTFILKVPTFVRFSDHHFDVIIYTESQKRFRQKFGKVQNLTHFPPTNLLVQMHAAGAQVRVILKITSVGPNSKLQNEYNCGIAKHIQFFNRKH